MVEEVANDGGFVVVVEVVESGAGVTYSTWKILF